MTSVALLILRLTVGGLLAGHGAQKLFGYFGGHGVEGTAGWLESLNLKPGREWAVAAGLSEFGGGLLTAIGALNPLGPIMAIGSMLMATLKVHTGKPIWTTAGGAELPVTNMAVLGALFLSGPGKVSFDGLLGIRVPRWFSIAALLGMVGVTYMVASGSGLADELEAADGTDEVEAGSELEAGSSNRMESESEVAPNATPAIESWGAADDEELPHPSEDDQTIAATERTDAV
jgi:putative oxidoreductase